MKILSQDVNKGWGRVVRAGAPWRPRGSAASRTRSHFPPPPGGQTGPKLTGDSTLVLFLTFVQLSAKETAAY